VDGRCVLPGERPDGLHGVRGEDTELSAEGHAGGVLANGGRGSGGGGGNEPAVPGAVSDGGDARHGFGIAGGAIGVGYAIGKAMQMVAKGAGGRKYQWAAALLSYGAIAVGMTGGFMQTAGAPAWAYPLFVFAPLFFAVVGQYQMAGLELLFAWLGVQWSWNMMRGHGLKVTGPFAVGPALDGELGGELDGETLKA
jgi:hypothetical protein